MEDSTQNGNESDWADLYLLLGRLAVAAGRAEVGMFIMLNHLERLAGTPVTPRTPMWSTLIKKIRQVKPNEVLIRVEDMMVTAGEVGKHRNYFLHFSWNQAYQDCYWGTRLEPHGNKTPKMVYVEREALEEAIAMTSRFAEDVMSLVVQLQDQRR